MKWFWPLLYAQIVTELTPRLPLIVTHSLTINDQKGSLPCRKFKGQCKIKRELFLGGAFLYFQIPYISLLRPPWMKFAECHLWSSYFHRYLLLSKLVYFTNKPKESKYHTIGNKFSLIEITQRAGRRAHHHLLQLMNKLPVVRKSRTRQMLTCTNPSALFLVQKKVKLLW